MSIETANLALLVLSVVLSTSALLVALAIRSDMSYMKKLVQDDTLRRPSLVKDDAQPENNSNRIN